MASSAPVSAGSGNNRRSAAAAQPTSARAAVSGVLRKGRRTKELIKRLKPGEIALIHHEDLDAIAGKGLAECRPAAVIDASAPITGRYPNRGPSILASARIPLFQLREPDLFDILADGAAITLRGETIEQSGVTVDEAVETWSASRIDDAVRSARANMTAEIQRFADNTLSFVRDEAEKLLEPASVPPLLGVPNIEKRHVVVVVRGEGYKDDLASIKGYLGDLRPIVIGVDGGADALLDLGIKPHIIIGDMDSVSDRGLRSGAKLVVHAYASSGDAPGLERVKDLGLSAETFRVPGTSEDAAMLLAYEKGAELIVAVGTHSTLEDFLDKGRAGMASTFLTRLKVGSRLVDARGVSRLHARRLGGSELAALLLSAAFVVVTLLTQSPVWVVTSRLARLWWRITLVNLQHLVWHVRVH